MKKLLLIYSVLILVLFTGCGQPKPVRVYSYSYEEPKKIIINEGYDTVWQKITSVLMDQGYQTEAISQEGGIISTQYLPYQGGLEVWIPQSKTVTLHKKGTDVVNKNNYYLAADAYLNSSPCLQSTHKYGNLGNTNYYNNPSINIYKKYGLWGANPLMRIPNSEVRLTFKVEWINEKQTSVLIRVQPKSPVTCRKRSIPLSFDYSYHIFFGTTGGKDLTRLKVPHSNGVSAKLMNSLGLKNDYNSPGSIKLLPKTQKVVKSRVIYTQPAKVPTIGIKAKLLQIKELLQDGIITQEEYDAKRNKLIESY